MKTATVTAGLALALASALPSPAHGRPNYQLYFPNPMVNTCATCHHDPDGGGSRNDFGLDFEDAVMSTQNMWPALWDLDSDGDGQTNGQELGDPCGTWEPGADAPRATDISLPGDASSLSADPDSPSCEMVDAGPGPDDDALPAADASSHPPPDNRLGGCSCRSTGTEGTPWPPAVVMLAILLGMFWRRRSQFD